MLSNIGHSGHDYDASSPHTPYEGIIRSGQRAMTICDGNGGTLSLDLTCSETGWLADACRRLLSGSVPRGASAIKVHASEKCYMLTRHTDGADGSNGSNGADGADGAGDSDGEEIHIVNLFDPAEHIALAHDIAWLVISLLERVVPLQPRAHA